MPIDRYMTGPHAEMDISNEKHESDVVFVRDIKAFLESIRPSLRTTDEESARDSLIDEIIKELDEH